MTLSKYLRGEDPRQLLEKRMRDEGRLPPGQAATINANRPKPMSWRISIS